MDIQNIQNRQVGEDKSIDASIEEVLAAFYDEDVAYTRLRRISSEISKMGGVRE